MSYLSVSTCVADPDIAARVRACVADEGGNPNTIDPGLFWIVAAADDVTARGRSISSPRIPTTPATRST